MNKTNIEWTDFTWNPVTGCYHGCEYCYARKIVKRFTSERDNRECRRHNNSIKTEYGRIWELDNQLFRDDYKGTKILHPFWFQPTFHSYRLIEPLQRKKPTKIFVSSMGDLFGEWVPRKWIEQVLEIVKECPQHTFQFLTKNPYKYQEFEFPKNCWLGTTIEGDDGENTYHRYWGLCDKKTNVKFVSFEPLLGMADIEEMLVNASWIDWVIIGALTGPKSIIQPNEKWIERIIDDCRFHGIPVFLKDNLNWPEKRQEFPKEG